MGGVSAVYKLRQILALHYPLCGNKEPMGKQSRPMDTLSDGCYYECIYERAAKGVQIVYERGRGCTKGATKGRPKGYPFVGGGPLSYAFLTDTYTKGYPFVHPFVTPFVPFWALSYPCRTPVVRLFLPLHPLSFPLPPLLLPLVKSWCPPPLPSLANCSTGWQSNQAWMHVLRRMGIPDPATTAS